MGLLQWWNIFFIQNRKLIAINNDNKSGRRGAKVPDSTTNGGKSYPLIQVVEWIFQTTRMGVSIWWEIKKRNQKYTNSEVNAGFSIVFLVILLSGYSIGAHLEVRFPFSTRYLPIWWYSRLMCGGRKSLFNMKNLYSKNTNGIKSCLILSDSNNDVDLNTFVFLVLIYHHLCNNFYSKVIVFISFTNKMRAQWWKIDFWAIWQ